MKKVRKNCTYSNMKKGNYKEEESWMFVRTPLIPEFRLEVPRGGPKPDRVETSRFRPRRSKVRGGQTC